MITFSLTTNYAAVNKFGLLPTQTLKIRLQNFTVEPLNSSEFGPWMCSIEDLNVCQFWTVSRETKRNKAKAKNKKSSLKNSTLRLLLPKFLSPNEVQSCLKLHRILHTN